MGALNSIPLCSKSSTGPVLELDDDDKIPGSDANNNRADTVVTQPIGCSVPEATSTPTESHSSIGENSDNELKDSEGEVERIQQMPTLDRAIIETTHDSGLDDLDDDIEHTIPTPVMSSSEDEEEEEEEELEEGVKDRDEEGEEEELERPSSPTPLDNESNDRIVLEKDGNTDPISNLLDDIITGSDSTTIIEPIR